MESILKTKKAVALSLCLTLIASNLFMVGEVFAAEDEAKWIKDFRPGEEEPIGDFPTPTITDGLGDSGRTTYNIQTPSGSPTVNSTSNLATTWQNKWSFATDPNTSGSNSAYYQDAIDAFSNTQGGQAIAGEGIKDRSTNQVGAVGGTASCAAGAALGAAVSGAMQQAASRMLATIATNTAKNAATSFIKVPVLDSAAVLEAQTQNNKLGNLESKETGLSLFGIPVLPSWDAIGYCIVNTMIKYISESTIRWINTGFKGNPAFIENFDQFFTDIANREISMFLGEIASSDLLCGDLRVGVQRSLLDGYNSQYGNSYGRTGTNTGYGACTFDRKFGGGSYSQGGGSLGSPVSLSAYSSGDQQAVVSGGWGAWMEAFQPQNNIYGASIRAKNEADRRIAARTDSVETEVTINNGTISAKDSRGNVVTPGSVIQQRLNKSLDIPSDRLNLADEFNEVVTALINQLIKVALDETVGRVNRGLREVQTEIRGEINNDIRDINRR